MEYKIDGSVTLLASNETEADAFRRNCEATGTSVSGVTMWDGPVPPNSYMFINPFMRMSTPEFFAFRMSNTLDTYEASLLVAELLSNVRTNRTASMDDNTYEDLVKEDGPRMTASGYREYLSEVMDTPEGARAATILDMAVCVVGDLEHEIRSTFTEVTDND